jgi:energy-coupling factor transporter ATP-binding protein EcfA2
VHLARQLGLPEIPLSVEELSAAAAGLALPSSPLPARPDCEISGSKPVLEADGIAFSFNGAPVLDDVSLKLRQGECLAVVGANGSGKTTLIKHFNGLYRPARGSVVVLGRDTRRARVSQLARHVGMAFQNANNQFFQFRVRDEIDVGARALGCYDQAWLRELVALFHLEPLLERSPYKLSEGEKKRVAFSAALAARPEILVLDEPTTGQDWPFRQGLGGLLAELRERGQTVVLVTHDLEFAEQHACRWLLLAEGQVLADGDPWEIMGDGAAMQRGGLEPTQTFQLAHLTEKTAACPLATEGAQR